MELVPYPLKERNLKKFSFQKLIMEDVISEEKTEEMESDSLSLV